LVPKFLEYLRLIRFANCLLAAVGVAVGAWMTSSGAVYFSPVVAALAAFLVCAAGNVVNDIVDLDIDRVNRPRRVLVRGVVSIPAAKRLAIALNLLALVLALSVGLALTAIALLTILLLFAYNLRLKKTPLAGNAVVAALAGLTFVTGGIAASPALVFHLPGPLVAAVFAFFFHFVREIVKDVQDMEGDGPAGVRSLPHVVGVSRSLLLALALFVALALVTVIPVLAHWYGRTYETITLYVIDLPLLAMLVVLWQRPGPRLLWAASGALKVGMILGLVALLAA
jgi:geranylgeranylglycerol-phosphate geranylgeranyltransferase